MTARNACRSEVSSAEGATSTVVLDGALTTGAAYHAGFTGAWIGAAMVIAIKCDQRESIWDGGGASLRFRLGRTCVSRR